MKTVEIRVTETRKENPNVRLLVRAVLEVARRLAAEEERTGVRWRPEARGD